MFLSCLVGKQSSDDCTDHSISTVQSLHLSLRPVAACLLGTAGYIPAGCTDVRVLCVVQVLVPATGTSTIVCVCVCVCVCECDQVQ